MKVKELIEKLSEVDPEKIIIIKTKIVWTNLLSVKENEESVFLTIDDDYTDY